MALKLESPYIPHKTEADVVRLNIQTPNELHRAYGEIVANGLKFAPQSGGAPVLVQQMVEDGVEVIAGISQDPQFGPVLLFGVGGIFVEVYNDVAMRACPITETDAREMIAEVRGSRLLQGFRGLAGSRRRRTGRSSPRPFPDGHRPCPPQAGIGRQPAHSPAQGPRRQSRRRFPHPHLNLAP